ncbi:hypothetical protein UlMin_035308 [Ulmus minor]
MATLFIFYSLSLALLSPFSSANSSTLKQGSSLSIEKREDEVLTSPNGIFIAGFFPVGVNAYCFAIWYSKPSQDVGNRTIVWMANRDQPVNGKLSKLTLQKTRNLILTDAGRREVWSTHTSSRSEAKLQLLNSGNLVLQTLEGDSLWESFDSPTDTLLPEQKLTKNAKLLSSRSGNNFSSGFYKLFFDTDNLLRLVFDNNELSSVYWPSPWLMPWEAGRSTYNNTKIAMLDSLGNFSSSDQFTFMSDDYGEAKTLRRLKVDSDGNMRLYSRKVEEKAWKVSWQAFTDPCKIHGICGPNSLCNYDPKLGRKCSCIPGHKMKNQTDWSYGCEPEFVLSCKKNQSGFIKLLNTEFYGYDYGVFPNYTLRDCEDLCFRLCDCVGFQYSFLQAEPKGKINFNCYPKIILVNGMHNPSFFGDLYVRVPMTYPHSDVISVNPFREFSLNCSSQVTMLDRIYTESHSNVLVKFILAFVFGLGAFELICALLVGLLLIKTRKKSGNDMGDYVLAVTGFRRFSFGELKKATRGFTEAIGQGAAGIVYKGMLSDGRVAAIKRLREANQGEAEFLAEVNIIGRVNHMNLIEMWGYCAEGKHRLLVYEYLEHGSLKQGLSTSFLDWKKRFEIAIGTARGLAYLHEECLEWVLHCDVKPQNILLGSDYLPKVADFGLSKLLKRGELKNSSFSKIRGTRGYMAPEWVTNRRITSKADVYSYGIVVLEMLTGRSPTEETEPRGELVTWVRETINESCGKIESSLEKIMDPSMEGEYDAEKMELFLSIALKCVQEDIDARPTMKQVVEMLQVHDY